MKKNHNWFWLMSFLLFIIFLTGCSAQEQGSEIERLRADNQELKKKVAELEQELKNAKEKLDKEVITLYFVKSTPTDFWLVPELRTVRRQSNILKTALEELIRDKRNPIPKETKVIDVTVKNFTAFPNFSREITQLSVGSSGEALVIASIANTLIKFPGVEQVQILVEGKPVESLAGHVDISKPVRRNDQVLLLNNAP